MGTRAAFLSSLVMAVVLASTAFGRSKMDIYGIQVKMNTPGDAYYDDPESGGDGTVTIEPWYDFAKIKVVARRDAPYWWGGYCDIFILAPGLIVDKIQMKGSDDTYFYVVGQTYHCDQFQGKLTFIGQTDAYGLDMGLGMSSAQETGWPWPKKVMLKSGVAYAPLLSRDYFADTKSIDHMLSPEARDLLFNK